jgi:hypothetical protein
VTGLPARVRALLADAAAAYHGRPAQRRLLGVTDHLDEPLRVALAGRVKAGKSTLLNALVGRRVAATDAGECTRVVTCYAYGEKAQSVAWLRSRQQRALPLTERDGSLVPDLGFLRADDLDRLRVELPTAWLAEMTLIDTPGMGSLSETVGQRTQDFLADDGVGAGVDAVIYLLRHLHTSDVDFLEVFHDAQASQATPVNAVGVLSRADEIGGGRPDAIGQARRVAAGYRRDPRIRGLVHTVVPVAGLLAEAAASLRPEDVAAFATLAACDDAVTAPMLLSTTRFVAPTAPVSVPPEVRDRLLGLLGMYGVRFALDAIRRGAGSIGADELAQLLTNASGLPRLRRLLLTQFAERRDVLKADSALRAIDATARADPIPAAPDLRRRVEQLRAGAHELAEIRLLTDLRTGHLPASPEQLSWLERLLGGYGTAATVRLGLPPDAPTAEVAAANATHHARWQRIARNPLTAPELARAATVAVRTCEGIFAMVE